MAHLFPGFGKAKTSLAYAFERITRHLLPSRRLYLKVNKLLTLSPLDC
jgi:hypothetical protein